MIANNRFRPYNHRMSFSTPIRLALLAVAVLIANGCSSRPASNVNINSAANLPSSNSNPTNDNVDELRSLINLPFEPEEVVWREQNASIGRLLAVVRLSPEQFADLSKRLSSTAQGNQVQVTVERWFPAELIAMSETTGEKDLTAISYPATEFFQAPYTEGTVAVIPETDYVIVDLKKKQ